MLSRLLPTLSALLLASSFACAQVSVNATAIVEKLDQAPPCFAKATHRIKCTDTYLFAGQGVDLGKWEGKAVDFEGALQLAFCTAIRVDKIAAAQYALTIAPAPFNQSRIGDLMTWRTSAPTLALVPLTFGARSVFLPIPTVGTLQLDPLTLYVHSVNVSLLGFALDVLRIPNDTRLIGVEFRNHGAFLDLSSAQPVFRLLNVDCFRLAAR